MMHPENGPKDYDILSSEEEESPTRKEKQEEPAPLADPEELDFSLPEEDETQAPPPPETPEGHGRTSATLPEKEDPEDFLMDPPRDRLTSAEPAPPLKSDDPPATPDFPEKESPEQPPEPEEDRLQAAEPDTRQFSEAPADDNAPSVEESPTYTAPPNAPTPPPEPGPQAADTDFNFSKREEPSTEPTSPTPEAPVPPENREEPTPLPEKHTAETEDSPLRQRMLRGEQTKTELPPNAPETPTRPKNEQLEPPPKASAKRYLKSRELWLTLLVVIGGGLGFLFLFFMVILPELTLKGESVSVPRVINLPLEEATAQLEEANLSYRVDSQYEPSLPPHTVLIQEPRNLTRVKPGRTVTLIINKAEPPMIKLPKIVNTDIQQVQYLLESWGLKVGRMTYVAGNEPDVVKKAFVDGDPVKENMEVLAGSRVDLVISRGVKRGKVKLPDVRDMALSDAIAVLNRRGLGVNQPPQYKRSATVPNGHVIRMDPNPEFIDSVAPGYTVELQVSGSGFEAPTEGMGDNVPADGE